MCKRAQINQAANNNSVNQTVKIHRLIYAFAVKPVLNGHSQKDQTLFFNTDYHLMQVKSIAECSKGSILQYFRSSLSYHLSLSSLFCLFLSGHFTQVLLYPICKQGRLRPACASEHSHCKHTQTDRQNVDTQMKTHTKLWTSSPNGYTMCPVKQKF